MLGPSLNLAVLYTLFAGLSTAINMGAQMASMWAYRGPFAVELSILVGTAAGLPVRYLLEKHYIFRFKSRSAAHDGQLFALYAFMGIFTTALFWVVEYGFHLAFGSDTMRYLGGLVGLSAGFLLKYHLDKRFVFVSSDSSNKVPQPACAPSAPLEKK